MPKKGSKYKIYKYDPYVSVPRATRYYHSKKKNSSIEQHQVDSQANILYLRLVQPSV